MSENEQTLFPAAVRADEDPFAMTVAEREAYAAPTALPAPNAAAEQFTQSLVALISTVTPPKPALDEDKVRALIADTLAQQQPRRVVVELGEYASRAVDGPLPINFFRIVKLLNARQDTLLVGPAGCGKTHTVRKAAQALGLAFASISVTAGMSEGALVGRLLPTGDGGKFEYARSEFVRLYEEGGVFLLDELDAADANTLLALNSALANGHMSVPARIDNPSAERHPEFVCVGTANTYGNGADRQYVGREQLDATTLDRFRAGIVTCDYDSHIEASLIDSSLLAWGQAMRAKIAETGLRRFVSTRFLLDGSKLFALKMATNASLMDSFFADWSTDERVKVGGLCPSEQYDPMTDAPNERK